MSKLISKKDMAARAAVASTQAPSINDRLRHAQDLAGAHPFSGPSTVPSPATPAAATTHIDTDEKPHLERVALDLIDPNPFNARHVYRTERVSELAASMAANGQEVPGIATVRNGRYVLAAGHYRLRGLKVLNAPTMDVMVHTGLTDRQLYALSYRENAEREAQSVLDNALAWHDLLKEGVYASETEIAEATGYTQPNVNKVLATLRLSDRTLDVVKENPTKFALTVLYELVLYEKVAGTDKAIAMARGVLEGDVGRKEINEARTRIESPSQRKAKEISRQHKITSDGEEIGVIKDWDNGRVQLDIRIEDQAAREQLVNELRKRFGLDGDAAQIALK